MTMKPTILPAPPRHGRRARPSHATRKCLGPPIERADRRHRRRRPPGGVPGSRGVPMAARPGQVEVGQQARHRGRRPRCPFQPHRRASARGRSSARPRRSKNTRTRSVTYHSSFPRMIFRRRDPRRDRRRAARVPVVRRLARRSRRGTGPGRPLHTRPASARPGRGLTARHHPWKPPHPERKRTCHRTFPNR